MARLVLDTNILISALGWEGKPRKAFVSCISGGNKLIISLDLLGELITVFKRKKFDFIEIEKKAELLKNLMIVCELVKPEIKLNIIREDPADNKIIECAIAGKADYIISGDAHLLELKQYGHVKIVSADEFLRENS